MSQGDQLPSSFIFQIQWIMPEYKNRVFKETTADYVLSCMETTATTGTGLAATDGVHLFLVEKATFCNHKLEIFHNNT